MIKLFDVTEQNWLSIAALHIEEDQKGFLDCPLGIIARGYAYRHSNAQVIGIANEEEIVGVALVKDLDEEPACYDLQQFMIDKRFQGMGYGTQALGLILARLKRERRYRQVEVCVSRRNTAGLRLFENAGFEDTGYTDESAPDCLNLMYRL